MQLHVGVYTATSQQHWHLHHAIGRRGGIANTHHTPMSLPLVAARPLRSVHRNKHCVVGPVLYYEICEVTSSSCCSTYPLSLACTSAPCLSNNLTTDTLLYPHARCSGVDCNHNNSVNDNTFYQYLIILVIRGKAYVKDDLNIKWSPVIPTVFQFCILTIEAHVKFQAKLCN